ncbi:phage GP46 family protein [Rhodopila sp.]|uniref:phage GP46 family protein n=1 Tax=Rhodopila sp. TaxID=2480087 RepID=UPI003D139F4B
MDIGLQWDAASFRGDWGVTTGDLAIDPGGLRTAVLLSLFTDQVAPPDYVPPAGSPTGRRGWWGDTFEGYPIGSLLWTLDRSKINGSTALLAQVQGICNAALQWLIDAGVVATVTTVATYMGGGNIGLSITLTQPQSPPTTFNFAWSWQGA